MKIYSLFILVTFFLFSACQSKKDSPNEIYPKHVGDILFDAELDDPNFKMCSEYRSRQYYNGGTGLNYDGEKKAILEHFEEYYKSNPLERENGFITIRFIVNCERKTGRFRVFSMDMEYQERVFDERITAQLLKLTKELDGWNFPPPKRRKLDYYQYLTFKIESGQITEIMP